MKNSKKKLIKIKKQFIKNNLLNYCQSDEITEIKETDYQIKKKQRSKSTQNREITTNMYKIKIITNILTL